MALAARADVLLQARARAAIARRRRSIAAGRARVGRAQAARRRADRRVGRGAPRGPAARGAARQAADAALQAGQELARVEGACRRVRRARRRIRWRCWPRAAPFRRRTTTTTTRSSRRRFRKGARVPRAGDAAPPLPELPRRATSAPSRSTMRRPPRSTTRSRCASCAERQLRDRHPHRCAGARHSARLAARRDGARAAVDGLHARPQDHDAARRGRSTRSRWPRAAAAPALSLYAEVAHRRRARPASDARQSRAGRRQSASRRDRRGVRQRAARRRPIRRGRRSCACCGSSRNSCRTDAARRDITRVDYSFNVDWDARPEGGERGTCASSAPARQPARQARRRADDLRQQHSGASCSPTRTCAGLYRDAIERQGQDEHAPRRAPGAGPRALPVVELAAAALQRPRQPAAAAGGRSRAQAAVRRERRRALTPRSPISRRPTRATPSSRTGWSTTGACAGCCRSASARRRRR